MSFLRKNKIIIDLDGTLISCKDRVYSLFKDITKSKDIDFNLYWMYKFEGLKNYDILQNKLNFSPRQVQEFNHEWMKKIESDYYLNMDSVFPGVIDFLNNLYRTNDLFICSSRNSYDKTCDQLKRLNLITYFQDIFITKQKYSKYNVLKSKGFKFSDRDWIIGDTDQDICTGKLLKINTCAVLTGFMSELSLKEYKPDKIIKKITLFYL